MKYILLVVKGIDFVFNFLLDVLVVAAKVMILAMTVIMCVAVFVRYVLNSGLNWSDEVAMMMMVYVGFIAIAYGVKHQLHLSVEIFYNMFPAIVQTILTKITTAIIAFLGVMMAHYGILLVQSAWGSAMTATRLPNGLLYAMVPVSGVFVAYFSLMQLVGYKSSYGVKKEEE